jgi:competence protein ComEA
MKKLISTFIIATLAVIAAPSFAESTATTPQAEAVILYVDINNDGAEKLADLLKGVGLKKAEAIVAYRAEHGAFMAIEDLLNVPGIGPATLEKNRTAITLGETEY